MLQAVRASVLESVSSQAESRRAQSSLALQLAVQTAVRSAVEQAVMTMLASSTETVMTGGMKKELVEIYTTDPKSLLPLSYEQCSH